MYAIPPKMSSIFKPSSSIDPELSSMAVKSGTVDEKAFVVGILS
jgi:hypothetical protein